MDTIGTQDIRCIGGVQFHHRLHIIINTIDPTLLTGEDNLNWRAQIIEVIHE